MKKILSVFVCLLLVAALAVSASAAEASNPISAPSQVTMAETFNVTFYANTGEAVTAFAICPVYDGFELVSCAPASDVDWDGESFAVMYRSATEFNGAVGTLTLKAKSDAVLGKTYLIGSEFYTSSGLSFYNSAPVKVVCAAHNAGDAANCTEPQKCTECGIELNPAKGHNWIAATCEVAKHCGTCGICEDETLADHTWVNATCETPKTCSVCKKTEGEALGHKWVAANCETPKTCSVCKKTEGKALGHTAVKVAGVAATCTTAGKTDGEKCSVCNKTLKAQTDIKPLGHQSVKVAGVAATCTTAGKTEGETCSVCKAVLKAQEEIKALGHKEVVKETAATCGKDGVKTYTCSKCNVVTKTEVIKATEQHDNTASYKDNADGTHSALCDCGEAIIEKHEYTVEGPITVKPSTSNAGKQDMLCVCGAKTVKTLPQLPADLDEVPKTGDITIQVTLTVATMISMAAAAAYVFKRKIAK